MQTVNARTVRLLGQTAMDRLQNSRVILFGVGGVGSYAGEALCRIGVGEIHLVDGDTVSESNINRQLVALTSTVGQPKAQVMAARMRDIRPESTIVAHDLFYDETTCEAIDLSGFDYVLDAIDSVESKVLLIEKCHALGIPVLSCMGAGNRLDPMAFRVSPITKTNTCPLARKMRRELVNRGLGDTKVVWSTETPIHPEGVCEDGSRGPGSISFVPSAAGLLMAGECVKYLIGKEETK